jgi:hypothetical protein
MSACKTFSRQQVHQLLDEVLGPGLHAKRIASLADATLGTVLHGYTTIDIKGLCYECGLPVAQNPRIFRSLCAHGMSPNFARPIIY